MRLLIDEYPLQVLPTLAKLIGLKEAIFLQQLHYWLQKPSAHEKDGQRWVYNTIAEWVEQLPFWSERTLQRLLAEMTDAQLIFRENFNTDKRDRTWWYTINYKLLDALCDKGYSNIQYGTMQSDKLTPSRIGQADTMQSDNLAPSAREVEARTRLSETTTETTQREERAREEFPQAVEKADSPYITCNACNESWVAGSAQRHVVGCENWGLPDNIVDTQEDEQPGSNGDDLCPYCGTRADHDDCSAARTLGRIPGAHAPETAPIPIDVLDHNDPVLVTAEDCALHYDPAFLCTHIAAAMPVLESVLGRKPKTHRHLHTFVHEHTLAEVLAVVQHFTAHEKDRSKWTVGLIFAPDNADARLAAVKAPSAPSEGKRSPQDLSRYDKPRTYEHGRAPVPPPEDERMDVSRLVADVVKTVNANEIRHAEAQQKHSRDEIRRYVEGEKGEVT